MQEFSAALRRFETLDVPFLGFTPGEVASALASANGDEAKAMDRLLKTTRAAVEQATTEVTRAGERVADARIALEHAGQHRELCSERHQKISAIIRTRKVDLFLRAFPSGMMGESTDEDRGMVSRYLEEAAWDLELALSQYLPPVPDSAVCTRSLQTSHFKTA